MEDAPLVSSVEGDAPLEVTPLLVDPKEQVAGVEHGAAIIHYSAIIHTA